MKLIVKPLAVDFIYHAFFKEPLLTNIVNDEAQVMLLDKLTKNFQLRLNDLKFNREALSNNFIHFSRFEGLSFLDVSFGLEEVVALLRNPLNEVQVETLFSRLSEIIKDDSISRLLLIGRYQLSVEGDVSSYLQGLNPNTPTNFEKLLSGKGITYHLRIPKNNLSIYVSVVNSLVVEGGLFLSTEFEFFPYKHSFPQAFKIIRKYHDFILDELKLSFKLG